MVPEQFIQDGQIVLNIAPHAVHKLNISDATIYFLRSFWGVSRDIYVPLNAVMGIYARENGQGLFFDPSEYEDTVPEDALKSTTLSETEQPKTKKKPSLRLLD